MTTKMTNVLLWVGVVFACMCALTGLVFIGDAALVTVGYLLIGAGIALACGWPLRCRSLDKKRLAAWEQQRETNRELDQYLTDEDRALLTGLDSGPAPSPTPRQWKVVAPIAAALFIVGFVVFGVGAQDLSEVSTTTTSWPPEHGGTPWPGTGKQPGGPPNNNMPARHPRYGPLTTTGPHPRNYGAGGTEPRTATGDTP